MGIRNYSNTGQTSTLSAGIGATDTTITLAGYAGDPAPPFTAALARGTATEEIVLVTAVTGSTVTVTRGYDGTAAQAQGAGNTFQEVVVAQDFREANNHVNATSGAHGITGSFVGTTDVQTLTNKTLTSPTLSGATLSGTSTVATANVTTLTVTGTTTLAGLAASAVTASGLVTANAGITVPTGQHITVTDAPVNATDAVNKSYADTKTSVGGDLGGTAAAPTVTSGAHHTHTSAQISDATSAATASRVVIRDGSGRAQFVDPSAAQDAATKNYVDGKFGTVGLTTLTINGLAGTFSADSTSPPGYRKLANGLVKLEGRVDIANLSFSVGQTIFTLPAGARPGVPMSFILPGPGANGAWRCDITAAGVVSYGAGIGTLSTPSTLDLSGVSFYQVN